MITDPSTVVDQRRIFAELLGDFRMAIQEPVHFGHFSTGDIVTRRCRSRLVRFLGRRVRGRLGVGAGAGCMVCALAAMPSDNSIARLSNDASNGAKGARLYRFVLIAISTKPPTMSMWLISQKDATCLPNGTYRGTSRLGSAACKNRSEVPGTPWQAKSASLGKIRGSGWTLEISTCDDQFGGQANDAKAWGEQIAK